jgi:glycosyltransferase involved in cell wall biosynthesis
MWAITLTKEVQIASEIIAANAGFVVQGEVRILAEAIYKLLSAPVLRQKLGENGKHLALSCYCWNTVAKNLTSVYGAIINNNDVIAVLNES